MATPTQHRTSSQSILDRGTSDGKTQADSNALTVAEVHAILANAAGTGDAYTAAEAALTAYEAAPWSYSLLLRAKVLALLATR